MYLIFLKAEVAALASQPSSRFDKEGTLFIRERQEGFFRRTESEWILCMYYVFHLQATGWTLL